MNFDVEPLHNNSTEYATTITSGMKYLGIEVPANVQRKLVERHGDLKTVAGIASSNFETVDSEELYLDGYVSHMNKSHWLLNRDRAVGDADEYLMGIGAQFNLCSLQG